MRQKSTEEMVPVSCYVPKSLHKRIEELAKAERRSISSEIVILVEKALAGAK